jgi:hypothetical protein
VHLSTSLPHATYKHGCKSHSTRVTSHLFQRQVGMKGAGHFSGKERSYIGHSYLPEQFKQMPTAITRCSVEHQKVVIS